LNEVTIYAATPDTVIRQTVGIEVMTADSLLSATERVAAYIYEDLRELAARANINLATAVQMPPVYTNDPNLFQRLLCLDIEHLLRDRHTTDLAMVLADPVPNVDGQLPLRYRASYHVVRMVDWASAVDKPDTMGLRDRVTRHGGHLEPAVYERREGQFAVAVKWNPQTANTREIGMRYPHYHFHWSPSGSISFNDEALPIAVHSGPLFGQSSPSIAAYTSPMDGIWTVNTISHTVPSAYRPRPAKKPRLLV
jgi:hypothetical protein